MLRHDVGVRVAIPSKSRKSMKSSSPKNGPLKAVAPRQQCLGCERETEERIAFASPTCVSILIFLFIRWTLFGLNRIIVILQLHKELLLNETVGSHTAN